MEKSSSKEKGKVINNQCLRKVRKVKPEVHLLDSQLGVTGAIKTCPTRAKTQALGPLDLAMYIEKGNILIQLNLQKEKYQDGQMKNKALDNPISL
jgi:hypothetical protein